MVSNKPTNIPITTTKTVGQGTGTYKKTAQVLEYVDKGLDVKEAHKLVTGKDNISPAQEKRITKKYEKWSLMQPKRKNKVAKAVDKILDDFIAGDQPTYATHARDMMKEIEARDNPIVRQNLNVNVNTDVDPVDLSDYMNCG